MSLSRNRLSSPSVRRAKIVCTLGPASRSARVIDQLMHAGMDVVRLNFSHGTHEEHAQTVALIRETSARYQRPIGILADLQGPKIRTGTLEDGRPVQLRAGQSFLISMTDLVGTAAGGAQGGPHPFGGRKH